MINKTYDVTVIGGGVIGTSVAYHLVKKGFSVALIEKKDLARGTSSHCDAAALIVDKMPGVDAALGYASIKRFLELKDELSYDFELTQNGSMYVCESDQEMEIASKYARDMQADGYKIDILQPKELLEYEPFMAKDLKGGIFSKECCGLNPFKLCFAFVDQVNGKGLEAAQIALRQHKNLTFERTIVYRSKVKSKSLLYGPFGPPIGGANTERYTIVDSPRTSITGPSVVILPQDPNSVFSLDKMEVLVEEKVTLELSPMNVIALSNYASNKGSQKIIKRLQRIVKGEATIVERPDVKDSICVYLKNLGPTTGKYYTTEVSHKVSPDGGYLTSLSVIRAGNAVTMVTSEAEEEASSQKQQFVNGIAKKAEAIVPKYNANRTKLYNALEDLYKKNTINSGTSVMGTVQPDGSYSYISSPSGTSQWVRQDWRAPMKAAEVDERGNPLPLDNNSKQQ